MRLRVKRRALPDDIETADEFARVMFPAESGGLDLRPSFYEASRDEVVRVWSEHSASFMRSAKSWDLLVLDDLGGQVADTPGKTQFQFTTTAHRELVFQSAGELRNLAGALMGDLTARTIRVQKKDVKAWVQRRLAAQDMEWVFFCSSRPGNSHCKS